MVDFRLMSADLGNGFCKVKTKTRRLSFPSVVSVEDERLASFEAVGLSSNHDFVIGYDDRKWAVGETVYTRGLVPVSVQHRTRIGTEYYKVLFAACLALGIGQTSTVHAILSLPPGAYTDKDDLVNTLAGEYKVVHGKKTQTYTVPRDCFRVIIEGFGTAALFCLNPKGEITDRGIFEAEVGIIDVGTFTSDFIQLSKMKLVRGGTDTLSHALSDVHQKLRTYAAKEGVNLDPYEAEIAFRQGYFKKGGRLISITEPREAWSKELATLIDAHLRRLWDGGNRVEEILITGGGGPFVADYLKGWHSHVRPFDQTKASVAAWESNAEGAYRYALFLEAFEEAKRKK